MDNIINGLSIMIIAIIIFFLYILLGDPFFLFVSGTITGLGIATMIMELG